MSLLLPADMAHAGVIAAMHRICFTDFWDERSVGEILAMPGAYGWIAREAAGSEPQGLILCRAAAGEAEVLTLLVLPPWRRRGLASRLIEAACRSAKDAAAEAMFLEAAATNDAALALYAGHQFKEVGRRPRYYGGRTDAVIMRREL